MQYDKNKTINLLLDPFPIKYLPDGTNVLSSLIATIIKECDWSDAWKFVAFHCKNSRSLIHFVYFDQSYSPILHDDSFIINISIADFNGPTAMIFDVSNAFYNNNVTIHEILCFSSPPYYLDWFEILTPVFPSIEMKVHFFSN